MAFTDIYFVMAFLPISLVIYWMIPKSVRWQNTVLFVLSMVFYGLCGRKYTLILVYCMVITWAGGMVGYHHFAGGKRRTGKIIYSITEGLNLIPLLFFKCNGLLIPLGLSYYVFQSSTYIFDLWHEKTKPQKNIINYMLFVSFFPTILAGPIQKSKNFLPKLLYERKICYKDMQRAIFTFMYGIFLKLVLADRIAMFTEPIFSQYEQYGGYILFLAAVFYAIQIYADFAGYSYMAVAVAGLFGFEITENFRQPYLATSITDFWRRWHISLTGWLREYVYIPLGGNRKGTVQKYRNIIIVFLISGFWHGNSMKFILWGLLHALFQIVSMLSLPARVTLCKKLKINRERRIYQFWQRGFVFIEVLITWIIFRCESVGEAVHYLISIIRNWDGRFLLKWSSTFFGQSKLEAIICVSAFLLMAASDISHERDIKVCNTILDKWTLRLVCYLVLIVCILVFGMYGANYSANSFIYAGF